MDFIKFELNDIIYEKRFSVKTVFQSRIFYIVISKKSTKIHRLCNFVIEFVESIFSTVNIFLFWKICNLKVASEKRFSVVQHLKTDKHIRSSARLENKETNNVQQLVRNQNTKLSEFNLDLCKAWLSGK